MVETDQLGRVVNLREPAKRIISVVPSQTELLYDMQLENEVIGLTKFCVHPTHWFRTKTRVGGTKQLHLNRIRALSPDLIIGNKEENEREQMEILFSEFPVWLSDINSIKDTLSMIRSIGRMTDRMFVGESLAKEIQQLASSISRRTFKPIRVAYLIWKEPWMTIGGDTFIHHILELFGFVNIFGTESRYPTIQMEDILKADPDYIFLSSEPYPFTEKHKNLFPNPIAAKNVILVDGEYFSWYGSRLRIAIPALLQFRNEIDVTQR